MCPPIGYGQWNRQSTDSTVFFFGFAVSRSSIKACQLVHSSTDLHSPLVLSHEFFSLPSTFEQLGVVVGGIGRLSAAVALRCAGDVGSSL